MCTRFHLGFLSLSGDEQIVLRSRDISSGRVIKLQFLSGRGLGASVATNRKTWFHQVSSSRHFKQQDFASYCCDDDDDDDDDDGQVL